MSGPKNTRIVSELPDTENLKPSTFYIKRSPGSDSVQAYFTNKTPPLAVYPLKMEVQTLHYNVQSNGSGNWSKDYSADFLSVEDVRAKTIGVTKGWASVHSFTNTVASGSALKPGLANIIDMADNVTVRVSVEGVRRYI